MNQSTGTRAQSGYSGISIAGGDTAQPLALAKCVRCIERHRVSGATRFLGCGCGAGEYVFKLIDRLGLDALRVASLVTPFLA